MITSEMIQAHHVECERHKKDFGAGPWSDEPNRVEWIHENGLHCLASRHPSSGHWCGYVGLKPGHKYYGIPDSTIYVDNDEPKEGPYAFNLSFGHGGITYGRFCEGDICHITDNEDERLYWLGFDCAHSGDFTPNSMKYGKPHYFETYKRIEYVERRVNEMAEELANER